MYITTNEKGRIITMEKIFKDKDNSLYTKKGLAKRELKLSQLFEVTDTNDRIPAFELDKQIKEGPYKSAGDCFVYRSKAKKVFTPAISDTIIPDDEITKDMVKIHYEYWVPEIEWLITRGSMYVNTSHKFCLMTNVFSDSCSSNSIGGDWNSLCTGRTLEGIQMNSLTQRFKNAKVIVNRILNGQPNLDLVFFGDGYALNFDPYNRIGKHGHKIFLQLSFIHKNIIHNAEEAQAWWNKTTRSGSDNNPWRYDNIIKNFLAHPLYDEELLNLYSLDGSKEAKKLSEK